MAAEETYETPLPSVGVVGDTTQTLPRPENTVASRVSQGRTGGPSATILTGLLTVSAIALLPYLLIRRHFTHVGTSLNDLRTSTAAIRSELQVNMLEATRSRREQLVRLRWDYEFLRTEVERIQAEVLKDRGRSSATDAGLESRIMTLTQQNETYKFALPS